MSCVIILEQPIRIGLNILETIGPFETIDAAKFWYAMETGGSIMPLPNMIIKSIHHPNQVVDTD